MLRTFRFPKGLRAFRGESSDRSVGRYIFGCLLGRVALVLLVLLAFLVVWVVFFYFSYSLDEMR